MGLDDRLSRVVARGLDVKTHCKHGHEYTEANTRWGRLGRSCVTCKLIALRLRYRNDAEYRAKRLAQSAAARARKRAAAATGAPVVPARMIACRRRLVPL